MRFLLANSHCISDPTEEFFAGGGGRVLPIPEWLTFKTARLPSEAEIQPWFDAVCALWADSAHRVHDG